MRATGSMMIVVTVAAAIAVGAMSSLAGDLRVAQAAQQSARADQAVRVFVSGTQEEITQAVQERTDFSTEPDLEWFSLLSDIWYERTDSNPDFAWDRLRSAHVKVAVASQLAQAYRNKLIPLNVEDIRRFALANYASPDNRVARSSVLLLGEAGNPADVRLLEQLARSGAVGRRLYKEAVTALVHICGEDAERAIEALLPAGSEDDRRFAQGWLTNRDHLVSSWCN